MSEQFPPRFDRAEVLKSYLAALLWTGRLDYMTGTNEFGGEPLVSDSVLDTLLTVDKIPDDVREEAKTDVEAFLDQVEPGLEDYPNAVELTAEMMGHDFCLTRNGHGAGFWDRGLGDLGEYLTNSCKGYGEQNLCGGVILKDPTLPPGEVLQESNLRLDTLKVWGC